MVYPQAPYRKITFYKAANVSSWYDILADPSKVSTKDAELTFNQDDIKTQCKVIIDIITQELNMFKDKDPSRIFL